jgi:ribosomal protein S7
MTLERKGKFRAAPEVSLSRLECAHAIAQVQDRAHADFVSQGENQWHVPTIAGPSDLVKEALMWLEYEARSREVGKTMFDECMAEDTWYEHPRSIKLMVV